MHALIFIARKKSNGENMVGLFAAEPAFAHAREAIVAYIDCLR